MSEATEHAEQPRVLRVAIAAADPVRRLGLAAIVTNAGHRVSERPDEADVVLADGVTSEADRPVVALGDGEAGQAALLPRDASPGQIDAAIRAVAAGLIVRAADAPRPAFGPIAEEVGAGVIVRGLRAVSDFEYEFQMAGMNARLNPRIETVFLMASDRFQFISSRFVKEIGALGGDVSHFVSPRVTARMLHRFNGAQPQRRRRG